MNTNTQEASNQNHRVIKPRILYLDVAKAIAITLVCVGHATYLMTLDATWSFYTIQLDLRLSYALIYALKWVFLIKCIQKRR